MPNGIEINPIKIPEIFFIKLDIFGFDGNVKTAYHTLVNRVLLPGTDSSAPTATSYLLNVL